MDDNIAKTTRYKKIMSETNILKRIAGTLKYGVFLGDSRKRIFIAYGAFAGLFFLLAVLFCIIIISVQQVLDSPYIVGYILALVVTLVVLSIPILLFFSILANERIRKEILLWLEDAIETTAYAKKVSVCNLHIIVPSVKIQVDFEIDGKQYSRCSEGKLLGSRALEGHHEIWAQYADRQINILYSHKYDQVLVLKDDYRQTKATIE